MPCLTLHDPPLAKARDRFKHGSLLSGNLCPPRVNSQRQSTQRAQKRSKDPCSDDVQRPSSWRPFGCLVALTPMAASTQVPAKKVESGTSPSPAVAAMKKIASSQRTASPNGNRFNQPIKASTCLAPKHVDYALEDKARLSSFRVSKLATDKITDRHGSSLAYWFYQPGTHGLLVLTLCLQLPIPTSRRQAANAATL